MESHLSFNLQCLSGNSTTQDPKFKKEENLAYGGYKLNFFEPGIQALLCRFSMGIPKNFFYWPFINFRNIAIKCSVKKKPLNSHLVKADPRKDFSWIMKCFTCFKIE